MKCICFWMISELFLKQVMGRAGFRLEVLVNGGPNGNRTRVSGVRGQRPRPLDDGTCLVRCQIENFKLNIGNLFIAFNLYFPIGL